MSTPQIVYVANTNNILLTGLKDELAGTYLNAATVSVIIKDKGGNVVLHQTFMDYIVASNGNYECGVPAATSFRNGSPYTALVDADGSDSITERIGHWELALQAKTRTA